MALTQKLINTMTPCFNEPDCFSIFCLHGDIRAMPIECTNKDLAW